jgi:hypothetical protein
MNTLPSFTIVDYGRLLNAIVDRGCSLEPVASMAGGKKPCVYLRHDVDFSVAHAIGMAEAENRLGVRSTYYILLTGPYNVFQESSSKAIRRLVELGHEIGLHYDLKRYPRSQEEAAGRLRKEIEILEFVAGARVGTIVMHEPFLDNRDIFLDLPGLINPSFYNRNDPGMIYISDSCRAWRDGGLLAFVRGESSGNRLHLNIHPESWLAETKMHRIRYLDRILTPAVLEEKRKYFSETVRHVWMTHEAAVSGYGDEDED